MDVSYRRKLLYRLRDTRHVVRQQTKEVPGAKLRTTI